MRYHGAMDDVVAKGAELALFGMGTVFVFLTVLVVATMAMSAIINRYAPDPVSASTSRTSGPSAGSDNDAPDPAVMAAIAAAVHRYRQRR